MDPRKQKAVTECLQSFCVFVLHSGRKQQFPSTLNDNKYMLKGRNLGGVNWGNYSFFRMVIAFIFSKEN